MLEGPFMQAVGLMPGLAIASLAARGPPTDGCTGIHHPQPDKDRTPDTLAPHSALTPSIPVRGLTLADFRMLPQRIILVRHAESAGNCDSGTYACTPDYEVPLVSG